MRRSVLAIFVAVLAELASAARGADSILSTLRLGELTPGELRESFPDTRTEIPRGDKQIAVHFTDAYGSKGVCRFADDRLFQYTVTLAEQSPDLARSGGWDGMVAAAAATLGTPNVRTDDRVAWDLETLAFSLGRAREGGITVMLRDTRLERAAQRQAAIMASPPTDERRVTYGGPYHLTGFRPGITRKVALTQGRYYVSLQHQGRHNFIVYLHLPWSQHLVANEIGTSFANQVISVTEEVEECFFLVECADGPWVIDVQKVAPTAP